MIFSSSHQILNVLQKLMEEKPYVSPETEKLIAENCVKYTELLQQELLLSVKYFPYGIRWIANVLKQ